MVGRSRAPRISVWEEGLRGFCALRERAVSVVSRTQGAQPPPARSAHAAHWRTRSQAKVGRHPRQKEFLTKGHSARKPLPKSRGEDFCFELLPVIEDFCFTKILKEQEIPVTLTAAGLQNDECTTWSTAVLQLSALMNNRLAVSR